MQIERKEGRITARFAYDPRQVAIVKQIPGRKWNAKEMCWEFPDCQPVWSFLKATGHEVCELPVIPKNLPVVFDSPITPFVHQYRATNLIYHCIARHRGLGVFAETGTGKTKMVVDAVRQTNSMNWLIVCPRPLIQVWVREFHKHGMGCLVCHGAKRKVKVDHVVITAQDTFARDVDQWLKVPPEILVVDESQCIKSGTTNRGRAAFRLSKVCRSTILLSGTPAPNSYLDLHNQLSCVDPRALGPKRVFYDAFCTFGGFEDREVVGYRNVPLLEEILRRTTIVIRKADCLDLPPKTYQTIKIPMNKEQKYAYKRAVAGVVGEMPLPNALTIITKLRQISSGFVYATLSDCDGSDGGDGGGQGESGGVGEECAAGDERAESPVAVSVQLSELQPTTGRTGDAPESRAGDLQDELPDPLDVRGGPEHSAVSDGHAGGSVQGGRDSDDGRGPGVLPRGLGVRSDDRSNGDNQGWNGAAGRGAEHLHHDGLSAIRMAHQTTKFSTGKLSYLGDLAWDSPTIIWYNYEAERDDIIGCLRSLNVTYSYTGPGRDSFNEADKFERGDVSVLLAQIQSLQYGVTLNRASRVIFYSGTYSGMMRLQCEDRCHRIGQYKSVHYISLIGSKIEELMMEAVVLKLDVQDHLLNNINILKKCVDSDEGGVVD